MENVKILNTIADFIDQYSSGVLIVYGPTATGKTTSSLQIVDYFAQLGKKIEIISADSRQVYRYMDIGTDKISYEIRQSIPHYGIDLVDPDEEYTAYQRQQDTKAWIADMHARGVTPLIVGGTGLYIDTIYKNFSLPHHIQANRARRKELEELERKTPGYLRNYLKEIDPPTSQEFHPRNTRYITRAIEIYEQTGKPKSLVAQEHAVDRPLFMIGIEREEKISIQLIIQRVEKMIVSGLVEEVQALLHRGYSAELQSMNGIGYRQTVERLKNHHTMLGKSISHTHIDELIASISLATTRYAKRQRTRFRRYEKDAQHHPKESVQYLKRLL